MGRIVLLIACLCTSSVLCELNLMSMMQSVSTNSLTSQDISSLQSSLSQISTAEAGDLLSQWGSIDTSQLASIDTSQLGSIDTSQLTQAVADSGLWNCA